MQIYHKKISTGHNCLMRGFEVDESGIIHDSWTFQRMGNGGLQNDENAAIPYIGKPIVEQEDAYKVSDER
jgi:hypothetical protein